MADFVHRTEFEGDAQGVENASQRAGRALRNYDRHVRRSFSRRGNAAVQNAAFQFSDLAVQMELGVDPARALGQQLPQLLGGFGALGAVLGATVAIGVPLTRVMSDMAAEGRNMTEVFGTLEPVADAIGEAFQDMKEFAQDAFVTIVNNLDRILTIAGTTAAFFAGKWVAGLVAARVATATLTGTLIALRTAILRTGIGALVIGAGELVFQFTRLVEHTGSTSAAFGLLADVAREAFGRVGAAITVLTTEFEMWGNNIHFVAIQAFGKIRQAALEMVDFVSGQLSRIPGIDIGTNMAVGAQDDTTEALARLNDQYFELMQRQREAAAEVAKPLESVQRLRDLFAEMKNEGLTLPDILGTGGGGEDGESSQSKQLDKELTAQEERIKEHFDRIKALATGGLSDQLGAWANYFTSLESLTQGNNERLLRIAKVFKSAQALIDAWSAYNQVLADPSLPYFAKFAAAAQVLAAGIGAVNAIKGVTSGGGGGGSSASAATGAGQPIESAPQERSRQQTEITLIGDAFSANQVTQLIDSINEGSEDGYVVRGRA